MCTLQSFLNKAATVIFRYVKNLAVAPHLPRTNQNKVLPLVGMHAQLLQLCLTLCDPMDCCPPDSFVHEILQARILKSVAMPSSRRYSWPRDWTWVSCVAGGFFTHWATWEAPPLVGIYWNKNTYAGTSLMVQWLRICLPMQGTGVQSLVQEDSTYCGATKLAPHNDWAHRPEACALQQEKPPQWEALRPQLESSPARHN